MNEAKILLQINIKIHQFYKLFQSCIYFCLCNFGKALSAKFLNTKTSHCASHDNGSLHVVKRYISCFCYMADKTSGKCITCTCWIKYIFQRQRGSKENMVLMK